jgi:late competence protein required for DNA uptake (superfamily II DNA/RNA helicase)
LIQIDNDHHLVGVVFSDGCTGMVFESITAGLTNGDDVCGLSGN